ncbi:uncharacterized protein F5891DRAFT_1252510 [Suillus fuscotomentosus]|uniref:Uncharacterized protein n=1 Tax=Suillus fuscotomentosus TaxID=1912939 RepID=A0AAD4DX67_9AGAM|nr:uncharacterized protein F5891DRAFT_1252510 [Suillus fuscotomentosus]KAG1895201.1 hypothetical protein F5891DRAFT_1252510 [Suillus fuscotomentosus]
MILQAALSYRAHSLAMYGVDLPMIKPWTSRLSAINGVLKLVDFAMRFMLDPSKADMENVSRELLAELVTMFLHQQMNLVLRGTTELKEHFNQLCPEILKTLCLTSHLPNALMLATSYADFHSLTVLFHQDTVYPLSCNLHVHTIEECVDRFGGMFVREVVRWCVVHGEVRIVFAMEESERCEWGKYMDEYWVEEEGQEGKCDAVAWLRVVQAFVMILCAVHLLFQNLQ